MICRALRCNGTTGPAAGCRQAALAPFRFSAVTRNVPDRLFASASGMGEADDKMTALMAAQAMALSSWTGIERNVAQRPDMEGTALFLCDLQEKFRPVIHEMAAAIDTSKLMLAASIELGLPVAVTEQYPRGLGHTVSELSDLLTPKHKVVEKVTFSMMCASENEDPASSAKMQEFIIEHDIRKVLICGVETHVCVLQTALDLLAMDIDVTIIVDGVSSQRPTDRSVALDRLANAGAVLSTAESTLFQFLGDAKHPKFKAVSRLVQQPRTLTEAGDLLGL